MKTTIMILPLFAFLILQGCEPDSLHPNTCVHSWPMYHDPDSAALLVNSILMDSLISGLNSKGYSINDCQNFHSPSGALPCTDVRIEGNCLAVPLLTEGRQHIKTIWGLAPQPDSLSGHPVVTIVMYGYRWDGPIPATLGSITARFDLQTIKAEMFKLGYMTAIIELRIYCSDDDGCMRRVQYDLE